MEYNLSNLLTINNLALEPFCLGEDNVNPTNPLLSNFYFNGLNPSGLIQHLDAFNSVPTKTIDDNDIGVKVVANDCYTLDYLLEDVTSLQQNDDVMFNDVATTPSLHSCSSLSSLASLDDLSFDLLEKLSNNDDDMLSTGTVSPPHSYTSSLSVDDTSLEMIETLDTNELVPDKQNNDGAICVDLMDTPLCSPNANFSSGTICEYNELVELLKNVDDRSSHSTDTISPVKLNLLSTEYEITCLDTLSPKSVDSGVSVSSSPVHNEVDSFLINNCVPIDIADFLDLGDSHSVNLPVSAKEIMETEIFSPRSVDSGVSVSSDESNADSGDIVTDPQSIDFATESNTYGKYRYAPYKSKEKTPDQKLRKKKQNRNAASKYRSKKKEEFSTVFAEANRLDEQNKELKGKVDGLRKEIDYLKSLMLDVINTRLSKKRDDTNMGSLLPANAVC